MRLAVHGLGVLGGFGFGIEALTKALAGQEIPPQRVSIKTAQGFKEMPAFLAETAGLEEFVTKKALRRVDHFSKMALLCSFLALQDAGRLEGDRRRMGIIIASGYGASRTTFAFLDSFINDGDSFSSPTHFSNSVHNAAVAHVSMLLGITGPGLTVSQFEMSVSSALLTAGIWLEQGRVDSVLFGAVDEYCDVLGYCRHRLFKEQEPVLSAMDPMAFHLQSAIPGEGAAFLLLSKAEDERPSPYGFIGQRGMGQCSREKVEIPEEALLMVGADGHQGCGSYYKRYLPEKPALVCYTPLYGSLPAGPAFDLAIAALSIRLNKVFPSRPSPSRNSERRIIREESELRWNKICCLKIGGNGEWGTIVLSPFH